MNSKQYAVLGLGIFGSTVATTLAEYGCEVIAVDKMNPVADEVTKAVVANVTDQEELRAIGIEDIDVAIVAPEHIWKKLF
ncbi:MAG: NAD-binding protein [Thomasclavelia ramosa]